MVLYYTRGIIPLYYTTLPIHTLYNCIIKSPPRIPYNWNLCGRTKMTISASTSTSSHLNCGPYLTIITTGPSKVAYMHCTRIRQGQAGVSAITRRPNAFIVVHEIGWASTRSRPGLPFCSIRNNWIVKSLQQGMQSSASGCST